MSQLASGAAEFAARTLVPEVYRHARRDVFSSRRSFDRFVEQHRAALIESGSLIVSGDQVAVHPRRFDESIKAFGRSPSSKRRVRAGGEASPPAGRY